MKVQPISYKKVKEKLLSDENVKTLYLEEKSADEIQSLLYEMRNKAGLNISQVAERMGISQPAVSKLERNADKATLSSLLRYARACGMELKLSAHY
ncbi:helix-turn-helix transcriptional regulator [Mannheimia sp. AT1]|uniref:Helix-turn-helix transcriptional regulator n=1 Tax=Mannheimia cairinae TaxID=3025936 RepID=A0ABT5MNJ1_9PAST|nr:helix-turn-helix transcriptional regulator [Mannheimia cairinae]MDD0823151.1 helix-turn-helix transcriptional regulator [Mannheimia cairinae]MDD0825824.1 helix-turn-helix transcriptional regulator [Mannheimia cairinae]